jgi:hypothetical protein
MFRGQLRNEPFIFIGIFTAQFVIEMRNAEHNTKLFSQFDKQQ